MATTKDVDTAAEAKGKAKPPESRYSAAELASAARARFDVPPEVVLTALKLAGVSKTSIAEAEKIIRAFMERKVKR
jgi:hypothetical protein